MQLFEVRVSWSEDDPKETFFTLNEAVEYAQSMVDANAGETYSITGVQTSDDITITLPRKVWEALTEGCDCCVWDYNLNSTGKQVIRKALD